MAMGHRVAEAALGLMLAALAPAVQATAADAPKLIAPFLAFPEGPLWLDGKLYFTEYAAGAVDVWDGTEVRRIWQQDGCGANSVIDTQQGHLLVACYDGQRLVEIDMDGKTIATATTDKNGVPLNGPNDFALDGKGGAYFTTSGPYDWTAPISGKVFHIDNRAEITQVADTLHFANGLAVVDGGKTLLVAEYMGGKIVSFEVNEDGSLSKERRLFKTLTEIAPTPAGVTGFPGPDGIKVDSKGQIYIAQYATGRFLVTDREGKLLRVLTVPAGAYTTNLAFGPNEETVFVTTAYDDANMPLPGAIYQLPNK